MRRGLIAAVAVACAAVPFAGTAQAAATTYYVSTTGNDANTCLSATTACATIQHAENMSVSGDIIRVAAGHYNQTADLTHPVTLTGAGPGKTVIDGTNIDYQGLGLGEFAVVQVQNTTGAPGYYRVSGMTIRGAYITSLEASENSAPTDLAVYADPQPDTVQILNDSLGAVQDNTDFYGIGFYDGEIGQATVTFNHNNTWGNYNGALVEGVAGPFSALYDTFRDVSGDPVDYPAVGLFVLADQIAVTTPATVGKSAFDSPGYGLGVDGGYYVNSDAGIANVHFFANKFAMGSSTGAAIYLHAQFNGSVTGSVTRNTGYVVKPAQGIVTAADTGGTLSVTQSGNTIKIKGTAAAATRESRVFRLPFMIRH